MTEKEILSVSIQWLRLPLMMLVVLLHTIVLGQTAYDGRVIATLGEFPLFDVVCYVSQRCIGDVAVPAFFAISGYLFYNCKEFDLFIYKSKIKRRVKSLLLPYILWNSLFLIYTWLIYMIYPPVIQSLTSFFENFDIASFLNSYWGVNGSPFLSPFWFIRDLIVLALLSYPLYFIIRKLKLFFIVCLIALWCLDIANDVPGIGIRSLSFFSIGAYFSIHKRESVFFTMDRYSPYLLTIWIVMLIADLLFIHNMVFHRLLLLWGLITLISLTVSGIRNDYLKMPAIGIQASFFVFAFHMFIMNIPNKCWPILFPINSITCSMAQILIPIVVTFFCVLVYIVLNKVFPRIMGYLMGGR